MNTNTNPLQFFIDPITNHYADFTGRATRQQFWMYVLIYVIGYIVLDVIADPLTIIYSLGLLVPGIAITARRLHDIDKSGWWQLIGIIPIVGWIIMIVWCAQETGKEANMYGPATGAGAPAPTTATPTAAVPTNQLAAAETPTQEPVTPPNPPQPSA